MVLSIINSLSFSFPLKNKEKRNNSYRLTEYFGNTTRVDGELAYLLFYLEKKIRFGTSMTIFVKNCSAMAILSWVASVPGRATLGRKQNLDREEGGGLLTGMTAMQAMTTLS